MNQRMKKELFQGASDDASSSSSSSSGEKASKTKDLVHDESSSSSESETKLTFNKKYAKDYQNRKEREELRHISQQRRDMGLGSEDEESSSEEEEDEDAELLTEAVSFQFLKTMKALKKKESSIYDPNSRFFEGNEAKDYGDGDGSEAKKPAKPKKFKDVLREQILEDMESENAIASMNEEGQKDKSKFAYDTQQDELRKAFLKESKGADSSDEKDDDWMVVKNRQRPQDDPRTAEIQQEFKELEKLSSETDNKTFYDPRGEVKDGEKFLINFIKGKKWIDKDNDRMNIDDDEESVDVDRADDFEAKYNFRFEQAAAETASSGASLSIQTYARGQTMNTIRRQDAARKDKRQARKERKEAERKAKEEQLKRLKNAKRQEMEQKLSKVKSVLGSVEEAEIDEAAIMKMLEGDYDPEKFEKAMQEAYGDEFYKKEDAQWKSDMDVRKDLEADEEAIGVVGQDDVDGGLYDREDYENEDGEGNPDGWDDYDDDEEYVGGDDPNESHLEKKIKTKLQDELYKLDYEDIVAGMPTRFKYRQVESNDYGLTTQEILLARDSTLKQFVSLKKLAPYNEDGEFMVGSKKRRRFREMLKQDLEEELGPEESNVDEPEKLTDIVEEEGVSTKKRRRLKKGKRKNKEEEDKQKLEVEAESSKEITGDNDPAGSNKSKKRKRKKNVEKEDAELVAKDSSSEKDTEPSLGNNKATEPSKRRVKKNKKKPFGDLPKSRLASYGL